MSHRVAQVAIVLNYKKLAQAFNIIASKRNANLIISRGW